MSRPGVNNLIITPTFTYNFPERLIPGLWRNGWFAGLTDYNITFDWNNGGAGTIPLGFQLGRVFHVNKQALSLSAEAGVTVKRPEGVRNPGLILGFEFDWTPKVTISTNKVPPVPSASSLFIRVIRGYFPSKLFTNSLRSSDHMDATPAFNTSITSDKEAL